MLANPRSDRVKAARALHRRSSRQRAGRFLAEGPQAVREVLAFAPSTVLEVFVDEATRERHTALETAAREAGLPVHVCAPEVMAALADTLAPQGICAVCRPVDVPLSAALDAGAGSFVVVLSQVRDPGNAGTVIRGADAAGAAAVIVSDSSVDVYNPKVVRSTAGSLWHLPVSVGAPIEEIFAGCRARGLALLAADGAGTQLLPDTDLARPHAWVMGNEAWGLPAEVREQCDEVVRVPIYGHAESLNLAMAATVCLYASAAKRH
ncbi:RNA methyltransferase [Calidifontibacter sp. DB0510]|uniref:RNA methyltransferase n=1 Tax=Metallococcus carri TaxID=1656884 RepID=A0A967B223_9MICO|nr:RNA methyltransferase [Metallococcus carri]NHN57396.1 RNA methyltransferase [Metallococcus carri]NOP39208.1 RNA methyltransferase [Calidifontibacter sp. DB2511S]